MQPEKIRPQFTGSKSAHTSVLLRLLMRDDINQKKRAT